MEKGKREGSRVTDRQIVTLICMNMASRPQGLTKKEISEWIEQHFGKEKEGVRKRIPKLASVLQDGVFHKDIREGKNYYSMRPQNLLELAKVLEFIGPELKKDTGLKFKIFKIYFEGKIEQWFDQTVDFLNLWHPFSDSIYALPQRYLELVGLAGSNNQVEIDSENTRLSPVKMTVIESRNGRKDVVKEIYHFRPTDYPFCGPALIKNVVRMRYDDACFLIQNYLLNYWEDFLELVSLFNKTISKDINYYDSNLIIGSGLTDEETYDVWENHSDLGDRLSSLFSNFKNVWRQFWKFVNETDKDQPVPIIPEVYFPRCRYVWDDRGGFYEIHIFLEDEDSFIKNESRMSVGELEYSGHQRIKHGIDYPGPDEWIIEGMAPSSHSGHRN